MENKLFDKCVEFGHSTPNMAVDIAVACKARSLVLFHLSPRYKPISLRFALIVIGIGKKS